MGSLDPVIADALNRQITAERQNSAIYAAIGVSFDVLNLTGMAKFSYANSAENIERAIDRIRKVL